MNKQKIGILGAGWLGLPLGKSLLEKGHSINASTTTESNLDKIREAGIAPFLLCFAPDINGDQSFFQDIDILILNIPPRRREDIIEYHAEQIRAIVKEIENTKIRKVIFVSSSSVYPELNRTVTEKDAGYPSKRSGEALIKAESILLKNTCFETTIVRFAGLVGPERPPGRFFAGKKDLPNGKAPINMIHQADCISIIEHIIELEAWGETFNGVADKHPQKQVFYQEAARKGSFETPSFIDELKDYKRVSNSHLKAVLGYDFQYPDPMDML